MGGKRGVKGMVEGLGMVEADGMSGGGGGGEREV